MAALVHSGAASFPCPLLVLDPSYRPLIPLAKIDVEHIYFRILLLGILSWLISIKGYILARTEPRTSVATGFRSVPWVYYSSIQISKRRNVD